MIYIEPNTSIDIIANAPIDLDGNHFLDFESETARDEFYNIRAVIRLSEYSYQRAGINQIKVEKTVAQLYTCNYLRFKNINYQERYIYCFITNIEYINNKTSLITYAVDVLQTWYYSVSFNACFVEREHVNDDTIGKWRYPEKLENSVKNYYVEKFPDQYNGDITTTVLNQPTVIITAGYNTDFSTAISGFLNSLFNSLYYNAFPNGVGADLFLQQVDERKQGEGIVSCFTIPARFGISNNGEIVSNNWLSQGGQYIEYSLPRKTAINNYGTPKNNKVLQYPYNYIMVRCSDGKGAEYKYEDFSTEYSECNFRETLTVCNQPQSILTPMQYKSVGQNFNESMLLSDYPQCSLRSNSYNVWLATQGVRLDNAETSAVFSSALSVATAPISTMASAVSGNVTSLVNTITNIDTEREIAKTIPEHSRAGSGSALSYATGTNGFTFYNVQVTPEYAKMIDDYFSMFGYAVHQIGLPNLKGRRNWNYVKTVNASINGAVNSDVEKTIEDFFNKGITIWHNIENFRNYNADNSIL